MGDKLELRSRKQMKEKKKEQVTGLHIQGQQKRTNTLDSFNFSVTNCGGKQLRR